MTGPEREQQRKNDTRRKIIAGAAALDYAAMNARFAAELTALLNHHVTRPQDRALFDFLNERTPDDN